MDLIKKFTAMTRLTMPGIFSVSPVEVEGQSATRFIEYRYDLFEPLSLTQYRNQISIDKWMHILYVYEPSPLVYEGKAVCSMYDIHMGVMCRIFAATNDDCKITKVFVRVYVDLEDLTQDLRGETATIREGIPERVLECVSRKQLMMWLL